MNISLSSPEYLGALMFLDQHGLALETVFNNRVEKTEYFLLVLQNK